LQYLFFLLNYLLPKQFFPNSYFALLKAQIPLRDFLNIYFFRYIIIRFLMQMRMCDGYYYFFRGYLLLHTWNC
jgi:hypothetical protein